MSTPLRIVIAALGGEGGGVLSNWIAETAEREGYISQSTSVAGVAQRTGATIYYVEIFPRAEAEAAGKQPVLSMFPTPGDVDVVICSEILEAGRMVQRGFVTPDRTTLVASTHRVYGITEKQAQGDGAADKQAVMNAAQARARQFIGFDMQETAREQGSVINAVLFGALAGTNTLPFSREAFEETIRLSGKAVDVNLKTFAAGFDRAQAPVEQPRSAEVVEFDPAPATFALPQGTTVEGIALLERVAAFPQASQEMIYLGVKKLAHYQDYAYAGEYLDRLDKINAFKSSGDELLTETARYLALWMAFEDLPRVAQIKISTERIERFRTEVEADVDQQVGIVEFLHPRVEEFCGVMPARMGRWFQNSKILSWFLGLFAKPRNIRTNGIIGYTLFYFLAKWRRHRRSTLAYQIEHQHIDRWFAALLSAAERDADLALELAHCGRLIKGYGDTRERGNRSMTTILDTLESLEVTAVDISKLRAAALADDQGEAIESERAKLVA